MAKDAFRIIERREIPELNAVGIFAEHKKTGLQLFHLLNDDVENWFCFGFSTPQKDSTGVPHILEHTVLCGSKNFPLKDPFLTLSRQNIATFLNAMTYSDKTIYPASSVVEQEYFTLMSVYGDAVFFPKLEQRAFEQEGHRFELQEDGSVSVQGVVFNEMLASYSDFNGVAYESTVFSLFDGTEYACDSGGDPRCIPDLTYKAFKDFHSTYYHPVNCKLFLVGNIPTEKQMDFIDETFLKHFSPAEKPNTIISFKNFTEPKNIEALAPPLTEEDESEALKTVLSLWAINETKNIKDVFLAKIISHILIGSDGAKLSKAILDSKLGELFSWNGIDDSRNLTLFNFGVTKIKPSDVEKVKSLIFETLKKIANEPLENEVIETALNQIEFENREIVRPGGDPFAIVLTEKVYSTWMYGASPFEAMHYITTFETLRSEILKDSNYIQREIKKRFIENKNRCISVITPSAKFSENLKRTIEEKCEAFKKTLSQDDKRALLKKQAEDEKAKLSVDDEKNTALIPHLSPKNLPEISEKIEKTFTTISGIPAFVYPQNTNGISYINFAIPFDTISEDLYEFMTLYTECISQMGTQELSWDQVLNKRDHLLGSFSIKLVSCCNFEKFTDLDAQKIVNPKDIHEREWVIIGVKMLKYFIESGIDFVTNVLQNIDFSDTERLLDILKQLKSSYETRTAMGGHNFAISRSLAALNDKHARSERLGGISQFKFISNLLKKCDTDKNELTTISNVLKTIHKNILENGLLLHITSDEEGLKNIETALSKSLQNFKAVTPKKQVERVNNFALEKNIGSKLELVSAPIQVGHSAFSFEFLPYKSEDYGKVLVLRSWMSSGPLWEQIRMVGGAYGAWAAYPDSTPVFTFLSYRDPNPLKSIAEYQNILKNILEQGLSDEQLERIVVGAYGKQVIPKTPYEKSYVDFMRLLNGKPESAKKKELKGLTETSFEDIKRFINLLLEKTRRNVAVVIANKESFEDTSLVSNFDIISKEITI